MSCVTPPQGIYGPLLYIQARKDTKLDSLFITADTGKTTAIVLKLVEPLLKQGRTVWMDNIYSSPSLARTLKITQNTDCVGTLKLNHKNVPPKVKNTKLKKAKS
jgi:predicted O-methyltransferase YrrM